MIDLKQRAVLFAIAAVLLIVIILSFTVLKITWLQYVSSILLGLVGVFTIAKSPKTKSYYMNVKSFRFSKFNMFNLLKKYRAKAGGSFDESSTNEKGFNGKKIREILSINPEERRRILEKEFAMLNAIDADSELSHDDKGIKKNLVLIEKYPFDLSKCRDELKTGDSKMILEEVRNILLDKLKVAYRIYYQHEKNMTNEEANAKAVEKIYDNSNANILIDMIAYMQSNHLSMYNEDEKRMIATMLIMDAKDIAYDVYSCDKNIISSIINDSAHREYMYMFSAQKDLVYLRNLYLLINRLEGYTSLRGRDHTLNKTDLLLIAQLKARSNDRIYEFNFNEWGKLSGITKLKLKKNNKILLELAKNNDNGERIYEDLVHTGEVFVALLKKLQQAIPELYDYESTTPSNSMTKSEEVIIDGADEANKLVSKDCPSASVDPENVNTGEWCDDGRINRRKSLLVHPDRNIGCQQSASAKFQNISNKCESQNKYGKGVSTDLVAFDESASRKANETKINDAVYFGKEIAVDDSFKMYLSKIDLKGSKEIKLSKHQAGETYFVIDLYDSGYVGSDLKSILQHMKHEGKPIHFEAAKPLPRPYDENDPNDIKIGKRYKTHEEYWMRF